MMLNRNLDMPTIDDQIIARFYHLPVDELTDHVTQHFRMHYDMFEIKQDMLFGQREEDWGHSGGMSDDCPCPMDSLDVSRFDDDEIKFLVEGRTYVTPKRPSIWHLA